MRHSTRFPKEAFSFDLHVLSTPPAFILSQDQTLQLNYFLTRINVVLLISFRSYLLCYFKVMTEHLCTYCLVFKDHFFTLFVLRCLRCKTRLIYIIFLLMSTEKFNFFVFSYLLSNSLNFIKAPCSKASQHQKDSQVLHSILIYVNTYFNLFSHCLTPRQ